MIEYAKQNVAKMRETDQHKLKYCPHLSTLEALVLGKVGLNWRVKSLTNEILVPRLFWLESTAKVHDAALAVHSKKHSSSLS